MKIIKEYHLPLVVIFLVSISLYAATFYLAQGQTLLYGDAVSRLNISRKIIDNLTPGLGQIGNVWLPLPQVLMIPLNANDFLWHSGIGGATLSVLSYVIGGFFAYKSVFLITKSRISSLFGLLVYALNINLLYLQSTAMSEAIFLCFLSAFIFFFIKWTHSRTKMYLIPAAACISALTIIRYEALSLLMSSILAVFGYTWIKEKKYSKAEGATVIFTTLACLGFALWTLYLAAIFKDPLYWINYYAGGDSSISDVVVSAETASSAQSFFSRIFFATNKYFTSMAWMLGLPTILLSLIGLLRIIYQSYINKTLNILLPMVLPLSIYLFMVATLMKNTPINQPSLTIANILSADTSYSAEFNIRYGILLLPWAAVLAGYAFNMRFIVFKIALIIIFTLQLFVYVKPLYTPIFNLPASLTKGGNKGTGNDASVEWLKENYDGGLILVSALKHDPQMFWLGLDYKTYIHEGTRAYWKTSLKDPTKYARWIIYSDRNTGDLVYKELHDNPILEGNYNLIYSHGDMRIYKRKD